MAAAHLRTLINVDPSKTYTVYDNSSQRLRLTDELREALASHVRNDFKVPPLPAVAAELHDLAHSPDHDIKAASRLVERDPNLAAQVIRLASSPAYGAGQRFTDVHRAAIRIGTTGLRDIAFAALIGRVFRCGPLDSLMRSTVPHAYAVGCGTAHICKVLNMDSPLGFLAGLVHDLGKQVIYAVLAELGRDDPRWIEHDIAIAAAKDLHTEVGSLVAKRWNLADVVADAALYHERPQEAGTSTPIVFAVAVANIADQENLDSAESRVEELLKHATVFHAGLAIEDLPGLAAVVEQARGDSGVLSLAA